MAVGDTTEVEFLHRTVTSQYHTKLGAAQGGWSLFHSERRGPEVAVISDLFCKLACKKYYKSSP